VGNLLKPGGIIAMASPGRITRHYVTENYGEYLRRCVERADVILRNLLGSEHAGRITRYRKSLVELSELRRAEEISISMARRYNSIAVEIRMIDTILAAAQQEPVFIPRLCDLIKGADVPEDDADRGARNTLFETYIAARFAQAAYRVTFAEPDVVLSEQNTVFVIAAKRLWSIAKLRARLREANHQIVRSAKCGLIAVDVSQCFAEMNGMPVADQADQLHLLSQDFLTQVVSSIQTRPPCLDPEAVLGVLLCAYAPAWLQHEMASISATRMIAIPAVLNPKGVIMDEINRRFALTLDRQEC